MARPVLDAPGFAPAAIDKVERLLELLDEISRRPYLRQRLVLHGGTALNVFHGDLPRLSVDVDLLYVGRADVIGMREERPRVTAELLDVARRLGYEPRTSADEHAGVTYRLAYAGPLGRDVVKVDLNWLDRVPLTAPSAVTCAHCAPSVAFSTLGVRELLARKIKALIDRRGPAMRDLFDLVHYAGAVDVTDPLTRALVVFYWSLARPFPCELGRRSVERFAADRAAFDAQLAPVVPRSTLPELDDLAGRAALVLDSFGSPGAAAREYLRLLAEEVTFEPSLLFEDWPEVLARARASPTAAWKVANLRQRGDR